jgi:hypothetical protein
MIYYSQIQKFKGSWTGTVDLQLRDGKKLRFTGFSKLDRKTMPGIFEHAVNAYREMGFDPPVTQSQEFLCSFCHTVVPKGEYECPSCHATYWHPRSVALKSLVLPAWGDFLMRHYPLAVMELVGYCFTWFAIIVIVAGSARDNFLIGGIVIAMSLLAFSHGMDAALTYSVAKKGLNVRRPPQ